MSFVGIGVQPRSGSLLHNSLPYLATIRRTRGVLVLTALAGLNMTATR